MSGREQDERGTVPLGYVAGVHGVRGWVKIHSWTEPREAILEYQPWLLEGEDAPVRYRAGKRHGKAVIVALPGVDDCDQARRLVGREIAVRREQLPEPARGHYYWSDLVGLEVVTLGGQRLGRVERLLETGANDVLVVRGERERLIPFVPGAQVRRVDLEAGVVEVDWDPEF